jgi:hypothetical protein
MRPEPWLLIGPQDPPRQPPMRPRASAHRLSELIARMERMAQRLQNFQQRYGTQLSHPDQRWLYQAQQQVEFYRAALAPLDDLRGVAPAASEPLQQGGLLEQLAKQVVQLAQATAQTAQILPVPSQKPQRRGRAAGGGRTPYSVSKSDNAAVYAILIVLGRNEKQESQEEASYDAASGATNGRRGASADHGAGITDGQTRHDPADPSMPFVAQHEPRLRTDHPDPGIRARRYHEMNLEEQLEILGRLRRRIERS